MANVTPVTNSSRIYCQRLTFELFSLVCPSQSGGHTGLENLAFNRAEYKKIHVAHLVF